MSAARRWTTVGVAAVAVLLVDQLTKRWAVSRLRGNPPIDVIWTLRFTYAENTGMAFSKGSGAGRLIAVVVLAIVVALVLFARRVSTRWGLVLIGIVIGGAAGNLVDRLFRSHGGFLSGAVVDWIDLQWWPVFNVADAAVVVGGVLVALLVMREPLEEPTSTDEPSRDGAGSDGHAGGAEDRTAPKNGS